MASTATVSATSSALTATSTNKTTTNVVTEDLLPTAPAAAKGRPIIAVQFFFHFNIFFQVIFPEGGYKTRLF